MQIFFKATTDQDELCFGFVRNKFKRFFYFNGETIRALAKVFIDIKCN